MHARQGHDGGVRLALRGALGLLLATALPACEALFAYDDGPDRGDAPFLSGTCADDYDLDFTDVRAHVLGPELVFVFERPGLPVAQTQRSGETIRNQVARLTINTELIAAPTGTDIPVPAGRSKQPPVTLARYILRVAEHGEVEQGRPFPRLAGGRIHFKELEHEVGGKVWGWFEITFEDETTLTGSFATRFTEI